MARKSVQEVRSSPVGFPTSDRKNDIADVFFQELDGNLGEIIFPGEFGVVLDRNSVTFDNQDVECRGLYVNKRKWVAEGEKPGEEFFYEQLLHEHYWPGIASDYPLLIVQGSEGIGKSTLLRYYFDCYMPNFDKFPFAKQETFSWERYQSQLRQILVFYVNLKYFQTTNQLNMHVFKSLRQQINQRFESISTENDYAMWNRAVNWSNKLHENAERAFPDRRTYRADYVKVFFADHQLFVEEAMWHLGAQRNKEDGMRKYYLTLILDNLDQQDKGVQKYLIKLILGWLGERVYQTEQHISDFDMNIWKVILPLRPETLREFWPEIQPIERKKIIELGPVNQTLLLETRGKKVEFDIKASGKQVEKDHIIEEDKILVYKPIFNSEAAYRMRQMLACDIDLKKEKDFLGVKTRAETQAFMERFCNDSIRRYLRLRKRLAMSVAIDRFVRKGRRQRDRKPLTHYVFLYGLLTGGRDHYHKGDPDNDIVNLYDTTKQSACAYSLLIGVHILYLLRGRNYKKSELTECLTKIGYSRAEIEESLETLQGNAFLRCENVNSMGDYLIYKENNIIKAHLDLLTEPAYTDAMAIVTPVEDSLRKRMIHTVAYRPDQFKAKATTTCCFLRQIRNDEDVVRTWMSDSERHGTSVTTFRKDFNALGLTSVYRKAAVEYRKRLENLEQKPQDLREYMAGTDWRELLNDEILHVGDNEANTALKAIIP